MSLTETRDKKAKLWARGDLDWYVEPRVASAALFRVEIFQGGFWDPACGGGNIVAEGRDCGYDVQATDVVDRSAGADWFGGTLDFLGDTPGIVADNIVTNPPFFRAAGAEAFIRKALSVARWKVAAFVDIRFLAGGKRAETLFAEHPPTRIWVVTPRVSCPPGEYLATGGKASGGTQDWCWLVWDKTAPRTSTTFHWLRAEP